MSNGQGCTCNAWAANSPQHARSDQLTDLERYRHALHEVVFACRTKISMKQKAREALFNEKTAHIPD